MRFYVDPCTGDIRRRRSRRFADCPRRKSRRVRMDPIVAFLLLTLLAGYSAMIWALVYLPREFPNI
jgi:hypothetical protein